MSSQALLPMETPHVGRVKRSGWQKHVGIDNLVHVAKARAKDGPVSQ